MHICIQIEKATLHYEPGALHTEQFVDHIADIGYQVRSERLTVPVSVDAVRFLCHQY